MSVVSVAGLIRPHTLGSLRRTQKNAEERRNTSSRVVWSLDLLDAMHIFWNQLEISTYVIIYVYNITGDALICFDDMLENIRGTRGPGLKNCESNGLDMFGQRFKSFHIPTGPNTSLMTQR